MAFVVKPKAATPAASVKDGTYPAAVTGIKQFVNTYGERIGFEFTILSGHSRVKRCCGQLRHNLPGSPSWPK
jgi:hypothetical protein